MLKEDCIENNDLELMLEGLANNIVTKALYAKSDKAERNIRIAETLIPVGYKITK